MGLGPGCCHPCAELAVTPAGIQSQPKPAWWSPLSLRLQDSAGTLTPIPWWDPPVASRACGLQSLQAGVSPCAGWWPPLLQPLCLCDPGGTECGNWAGGLSTKAGEGRGQRLQRLFLSVPTSVVGHQIEGGSPGLGTRPGCGVLLASGPGRRGAAAWRPLTSHILGAHFLGPTSPTSRTAPGLLPTTAEGDQRDSKNRPVPGHVRGSCVGFFF